MRATARKRAAAAPKSVSHSAPVAASTLSPGSRPALMVPEAVEFARRQRLALAKLLRVDEGKAEPGDRVLIARVMATVDGDGTSYDKALAFAPVNDLFARGVLYFARPA